MSDDEVGCVEVRMWVVGIDKVSNCWRVKRRVDGEGGHCACFLTCS